MNRHRSTIAASDAARWRALRQSARPAARLREGRNDWFRMSNLAGDGDAPAVIDIYDEIGWYGITAADFIADLRTITAPTVDVHINSPGGDVYDGIAIYSALVDHPASITVRVDALAASAASFIAQAGDHVVMGRNAEMMIHDAWGLCVGNAADMVEMAGMLDKASDNIASIYAARAGNGGVAAWRKRMAAESWYSAQEAVDVGLADEVAPTEKRRGTADPAAKWDLSVFSYASRAQAPAPDDTVPVDDVPVEDPPAPPPEPPPPPPEDEPLAPAAEVDAVEWPDDIPWDPKALHVAMCDAADGADIGVDTAPMREALEEFPYSADALRGLLLDLANQAPAPPPLPPTKPASRYVDIDLFTDSLKGALTP